MSIKIQPPTKGHVVKVVYIQGQPNYICDDYCRDKTPEEVQAILDNITDIVREPVIKLEKRMRDKILKRLIVLNKTLTAEEMEALILKVNGNYPDIIKRYKDGKTNYEDPIN